MKPIRTYGLSANISVETHSGIHIATNSAPYHAIQQREYQLFSPSKGTDSGTGLVQEPTTTSKQGNKGFETQH